MLQQAREIRAAPSKPKTLLQKRFWQDVTVHETEGKSFLYDIVGEC